MKKQPNSIRWLALMAWRDSRRSRTRLLLFTTSIVMGIAALVAINSFSDNLRDNIDEEAKGLIGADFVISSRQPASDSVLQFMDTLATDKAREISFASMALFKESGTRLVRIRALEGKFPFYGEIETTPAPASATFRTDQKALVDNTLLMQYNATVGDKVQVGALSFNIEGRLEKAPGEAGLSATIAPSVYIPAQYVEATGLIKKGSRINYRYFYKLPPDTDVKALEESIEPILDREGLRYETVEERKEDVGRTFRDLTQFLNLVAFIALLLGCVGVASAVHIYIKEKLATVAVLRCLGLTGRQAFLIYLLQITFMGFVGSVLGALIGSIVQVALPGILQNFLPFEVEFALSGWAVAEGIVLGIGISALFALPPLLSVRKASPLRTLRADHEEEGSRFDVYKIATYAGIVLFIFGFSFLQIREWDEAFFFTLFIAGAFAVLAGVAQLLMWLVRKYFPVSWSYIWRQGIANLYRPHNQTLILIVSVGLGTALIMILFFVQNLLINQVSFAGSGNQPNMVLFDIQTPQKEEIAQITQEFDLPVIQEVPIVTMRLNSINGVGKLENLQDTTSDVPDWAYDREYRITYRDTLISSETQVAGEWSGTVENPNDSIFISIEKGFARRLGLDMGDALTFNVQGSPITVYLGHTREIDWRRVQTNFLVVFPKGVLEPAPQFHVLLTKVPSDEKSAAFQQAIVRKFPNVSIIDLKLILRTLDDVLNQVSFVIRFMALFSIITGVIVLIGSVLISKFQRIQESVLLRTLGAQRNQILRITALEYFFLGGLASFSGILLALLASWGLALYNFEAPFRPDLLPAIGVFIAITSLTVTIGMLNSRGLLNRPPLEVLRSGG